MQWLDATCHTYKCVLSGMEESWHIWIWRVKYVWVMCVTHRWRRQQWQVKISSSGFRPARMIVCMHRCTYVCMCVCMFVGMYVCMYVCIYVCMYARRYFTIVRKYMCTYLCMYACMYVCMYICMYVCMYISMHACMYVCIYVCMHVCMYVYMYACMHACCMHICMDVRMFLHMPTQKHNYKRTTMGHHLHLQKKKVMYYYTQTPNLRSAAPCAPTARLNFPATPALVSLWLHCIYIYIYIYIYM